MNGSVFQTGTAVHDLSSLYRQEKQALARNEWGLTALSVGGQAVIGTAFYLYAHVSTPGYISILLLIPAGLLLASFSMWLLKRAGGGPALLLAGNAAGRGAALVLGVTCFLDAQMAAWALCALVGEALPQMSPLLPLLGAVLMTGAALQEGGGLRRLARLLRALVPGAIGLCALTALPHGSPRYLAPWMGYGIPSILQGVLWMGGCLSGLCYPALMPDEKMGGALLIGGGRMARRAAWGALLFAAAYALISAWLLPVYGLARPESLGWRMMLFSKVSASSVAWALCLGGLTFLLLAAFGAGVQRSGRMLSFAAGKQGCLQWLMWGLPLLAVPAAALQTVPVEKALRLLLPLRLPMAAGIMGILALGAIRKRGKKP